MLHEQILRCPLTVFTHTPVSYAGRSGMSIAAREGPESVFHFIGNLPLAIVSGVPIHHLRELVFVRWMIILVLVATFVAAVDFDLMDTTAHHDPVGTERGSFSTGGGGGSGGEFEDSSNRGHKEDRERSNQAAMQQTTDTHRMPSGPAPAEHVV